MTMSRDHAELPNSLNIKNKFPDAVDLVNYEEPIAHLTLTRNQRQAKLKIPVFTGKEILIGRDISKCQPALSSDHVSKKHFRIYSIIYEQDTKNDLKPLVYCEDLESTNGTYVNGECIGMISHEKIGHLLSDGDVIEVQPHWQFQFHQTLQPMVDMDKSQVEDFEYFHEQYEVSQRILGKGHYGAVLLAKDKSTSRQLACKIVNLDAAAYEITRNVEPPSSSGQRWLNNLDRLSEGRKLVMREIKILSKLSHPNIVTLKKAFCSDTSLYIFTELAPAGDLFSYIESHGGHLSDWHSRVVSRQILLAIEYMHSHGIIHRDIKPENVLIMQIGFGSRVVLTDFGFANYVHGKTGRLLSILGTEGFIAPEVKFVDPSKEGYTKAADLWSFGILTVCLLTGNSLIPINELSQLSQQSIADHLIGIEDRHARQQWQHMPIRALQFLQDLLVIDPAQRMTANQALQHSWYMKPATEANLIAEGYMKAIKFWRKRDINDKVVEHIPSRTKTTLNESLVKYGSKFQIRLPDATSLPYFSLDRHLQKKKSPQRQSILEKLQGSLFVTADISRASESLGNQDKNRNEPHMADHSVPGDDIFRIESAKTIADYSSEFSDIMQVPAIPQSSQIAPITPSIMQDKELTENPTVDLTADLGRKRPRTESEDAEDKRVHEDAAKDLPKFCSAQVYYDKIKRKRMGMENSRKRF